MICRKIGFVFLALVCGIVPTQSNAQTAQVFQAGVVAWSDVCQQKASSNALNLSLPGVTGFYYNYVPGAVNGPPPTCTPTITPSSGQPTLTPNASNQVAITFGQFNPQSQTTGSTFCSSATAANVAMCLYYAGPPPTGTAGPAANSLAATIQYTISTTAPTNLTNAGGSSAPSGPPNATAVAGDGQVTINITLTGGATAPSNGYDICFTAVAPGTTPASAQAALVADGTCTASPHVLRSGQTGTSIVITGLTNATQYAFLIGVSGGEPFTNTNSTFVAATPVAQITPLGEYAGPANPLSFSCNSSRSPSALGLLLFLGGGLFFIRRRKPGSSSVLFIAALAISPLAHADLGQWNVGLMAGPYKPNIDAGQNPQIYKDFFGNSLVPMFALTADAHLDDTYGSVQLGFALSYALATGNSKPANNVQSTTTSSVGLHMFQLRPRVSYVFDPYIDTVPLAPYVRVGLIGAGYVFTFQGGLDTKGENKSPAQNPIGFRFGFEATGGVMLALDWLEPSTARLARASGAFDHAFLTAEVSYMTINTFGQPGFDFSPTGFFGSAPLTMNFGLAIEF